MTLIAGCFRLDGERQISPELKNGLMGNLRRVNDARGQTYSFERDGFFLVKWDSGALRESAWQESTDGSVSALAGDPIYSEGGTRLPRDVQLEHLDPFLPQFNERMGLTRGSFGLVGYSAARNQLRLATDAIGVRTFYYTVQQGVFIFASALRILESIPVIERRISVLGTAEQCIYGQPLADRSPYEGIAILRESEIVTVDRHGVVANRYLDWSKTDSVPSTPEEAAKRIYGLFEEGIKLRAQSGERAFAFLSGGMDSRAIVATLLGCGHSVVALNFSPDRTQDQDYAVRFAKAAGAQCRLFCLPRDEDPNFSLLAYKAKTSLEMAHELNVERPQVFWSGDGGSVGLGHVYMDEQMVDLCDEGRVEEAVRYFMALHGNYLPIGVLNARQRKALPETIYNNVLAEVRRYPRPDVGRQIYIFLLMNDQRRHLFKHFESIDEHGLEFLTPFFDTVFLRAVATTPVRWGILHRLYAIWFDYLPEFALKTPWQTYPGHVECPVPGQDELGYQWAKRPASSSGPLAQRLELASALVKTLHGRLPAGVFSRTRIRTSAALQVLGVRDGEHALRTLQVFQRVTDRTK